MRTNLTQRAAAGAAAAGLLVALALSGCAPGILTGAGTTHHGQSQAAGSQTESATLDKIVAAVQSQIPTIKANSGDTYSDITIKAIHPNTISYTFEYAKQLDQDSTAAYFDTQVATLQKTCDTQVFPGMKQAGITSGQHAKYTYLNADGSVIWSQTFSSSD